MRGLLPILQIPGPSDCFLTGLCGYARDQVGPPPGLMYLALGLIGLGVAILIREARGKGSRTPARPSDPS